MVDISRQLAFAVKEEIIRNVLKSHRRILVLGLGGTGKTTCTLRALHGLGSPFYFSPDSSSRERALSVSPGVTLLTALGDQPPAEADHPILIIDDLNRLTPHALENAATLLQNPEAWGKIALLSRMLGDAKELMPNVDVVVKMKEKTAEMMFSNLLLSDHNRE